MIESADAVLDVLSQHGPLPHELDEAARRPLVGFAGGRDIHPGGDPQCGASPPHPPGSINGHEVHHVRSQDIGPAMRGSVTGRHDIHTDCRWWGPAAMVLMTLGEAGSVAPAPK